ncbi:MAG: 6-hydroxynicotinate reductase [Pseudomonadota bacterium]
MTATKASTDAPTAAALAAAQAGRKGKDGIVVCDACPVLCRIREGKSGACDRYANLDGKLVRLDPIVVAHKVAAAGGPMVPFLSERPWDGGLLREEGAFLTGIGVGTTYPDYKPAPFIVSSRVEGVDMVTVVTEGIFSYCGVKVKIDTDRYIGPEQAPVRAEGEQVGHVTTAEYGSQMLSLGGVRHLTGGSKKEGNVTCETLLALLNKGEVELAVEGGAKLVAAAGRAPVIDGVRESRMRVGCGSAAIGMFAKQWHGHADEVIVVDDHITGVLSEHQAGRFLDMPPTGIRVRGRKSTPGRYFQVADPGTGWGGTDIADPLDIIDKIDPKLAWPGLRLLMVSTTGEHAAWFVLDEALAPQPADLPAAVERVVERIGENCEPALVCVLFMAGAGGSLRAGVTENPVKLTRSVRTALTRVTSGGAPVYVWPGGGITYMVDVAEMPDRSFGYVPTPAIVGPLEFTLRLDDYRALGGHMDTVRPLASLAGVERVRVEPWRPEHPWPLDPSRGPSRRAR